METNEPARVGLKITTTLRKYEGATEEQIAAGEADDACVETLTLEDGVVVEHWVKDA